MPWGGAVTCHCGRQRSRGIDACILGIPVHGWISDWLCEWVARISESIRGHRPCAVTLHIPWGALSRSRWSSGWRQARNTARHESFSVATITTSLRIVEVCYLGVDRSSTHTLPFGSMVATRNEDGCDNSDKEASCGSYRYSSSLRGGKRRRATCGSCLAGRARRNVRRHCLCVVATNAVRGRLWV